MIDTRRVAFHPRIRCFRRRISLPPRGVKLQRPILEFAPHCCFPLALTLLIPPQAALASPAPFLLQKYYYHSHQPESGWCELRVILFWNQFTMIKDAKSTPTKIYGDILSGWRIYSPLPLLLNIMSSLTEYNVHGSNECTTPLQEIWPGILSLSILTTCLATCK